MTSQTSSTTGWRRSVTTALAGGALAAGLLVGAAPALADPATPTVSADAPEADAAAPMTADQALAIIASDYDTGAGGGQLSTLIHKIMTLRSQGYYASESNRKAIVAALDKRPNQAPLVQALEATLAFQLRNKTRAAAQPQQPTTFGVTPGGVAGNNGAITVPIAPGQ